jgi:hypothetical protein
MTYLLHGSNGQWAKIPLPQPPTGTYLEVNSIVNVPGTRVAYAVGNEVSKTTGYATGVILEVSY